MKNESYLIPFSKQKSEQVRDSFRKFAFPEQVDVAKYGWVRVQQNWT